MRLIQFILLSCLLCSTAYAESPSALQKLSQKIKQLKAYVLRDQTKKDDLQTQLKTLEKQIAVVNRKVYNVDKKITAQHKQLLDLQRQQVKLEAHLQTQRTALAKQLRALYQMGGHGALQIILSQQQPSDFTRMSTYYQSLNQARQQRITNFLASLNALKQNQIDINDVLAKLESLRKQRLAEQKVFSQKSRNRTVLLSSINKRISSQQQKISQLEANKKHLQKVVTNIAAEKPYTISSGKSFSSLKHKLPWPVQGRLTRAYGDLYDGRLKSTGVFITAAMNKPVRAIATGTVVFSKWLRGYGNLIIVSHKGGYMSLYGHNSTNLAMVGDNIRPGQEIALVGNSGGLVSPGLYFEIRYKGRTKNPALWCK